MRVREHRKTTCERLNADTWLVRLSQTIVRAWVCDSNQQMELALRFIQSRAQNTAIYQMSGKRAKTR